MAIFNSFRRKRRRKYPIQRDERGRSLRKRCFEYFDDGMRPAEVIEEMKMKKSTVDTYFRDWKRLGPNFKRQYDFIKNTLLKKDSEDREYNLDLFSRVFGITQEELENILLKPSGLKRLLTGKFRFPAHADADRKRQVALEAGLAISDYLLHYGGKIEDLLFAFDRLMKYNRGYREEADADTKEENLRIAFTRQVLEAAAKDDREGRPRRDRLTGEEQMAVIRLALEAKAEQKRRGLEIDYFIRIAELMAGGLTQEQAREKIYQDLIDKGDLEGAKLMREYQDIVHPLKSDNQEKPPPQPPTQAPPAS